MSNLNKIGKLDILLLFLDLMLKKIIFIVNYHIQVF